MHRTSLVIERVKGFKSIHKKNKSKCSTVSYQMDWAAIKPRRRDPHFGMGRPAMPPRRTANVVPRCQCSQKPPPTVAAVAICTVQAARAYNCKLLAAAVIGIYVLPYNIITHPYIPYPALTLSSSTVWHFTFHPFHPMVPQQVFW